MNKEPYCPSCGEPMEESSEGQIMYQGYSAFTCVACGYSTDCPPDTEDDEHE